MEFVFTPTKLILMLLSIGVFSLCGYCAYKGKIKLAALILGVSIILVYTSPIKMKAGSMSAVEQATFSLESEGLPERVVVQKKTFDEKQRDEYNSLSQESQNKLNSIQNEEK